jgi:hypothetical protein
MHFLYIECMKPVIQQPNGNRVRPCKAHISGDFPVVVVIDRPASYHMTAIAA